MKVYVVLTEGSLDERKWKLLQDKTASAELAIDGHLVEKKQKPISYQQTLDELKRKGLPIAETILESDVQATWQRANLVAQRCIARRDQCLGGTSDAISWILPIRRQSPQSGRANEAPCRWVRL